MNTCSRKRLLIGVLAFLVTAMSQGQSQDQPTPPPRVPVPANVSEGRLIKKVNPVYSKYARKNHIQGVVVLQAAISTEGDIVSLVVISGQPLLAEAAVTAVQQWKYRPYLVNGNPVEVQTEIRINFSLAGG